MIAVTRSSLFCVCMITITCFLDILVVSVTIECVPIGDCPFAVETLSKTAVRKSVMDFFDATKCGVDDATNNVKIWCNKFTNCRTSEGRNGTCIHHLKCQEFTNLLKSINKSQEDHLIQQYKCHLPDEPEMHVCCPWPTISEKKNNILRKKRHLEDHQQHSHNHEDFLNSHHDFHGYAHHGGFGYPNDRFNKRVGASEKERYSSEDQTSWLKNVLLNNSEILINGDDRKHDHNHFFHWWHKHEGGRNPHSDEKSSFSDEETCTTPNNLEGVCKPIHDCTTILDVLKVVNRSDAVEVGYLKKFKCKQNERVTYIEVCCPESSIVLPNNSEKTKFNDSYEGMKINDLDVCGRQIVDNKILGGTTTDLGEFPWLALLQYTTARGRRHACGGSIINKRYVLTAAHCVNQAILKQTGIKALYSVILGEYDTRNSTDCIYTRYGNNCADPSQSYGVEEVIEHQQFRPNSTLHDIALIKLNKDIVFSNYIKPICLPLKDSFQLVGNETFQISGWGITDTGETSPIKRKTSLQFANQSQCSYLGSLGMGQMCLASGRGVDSCKGDSGGPVMLTAHTAGDVISTLVGIISFGFGRCGSTTSVSTYVPFYLNWISDNMS